MKRPAMGATDFARQLDRLKCQLRNLLSEFGRTSNRRVFCSWCENPVGFRRRSTFLRNEASATREVRSQEKEQQPLGEEAAAAGKSRADRVGLPVAAQLVSFFFCSFNFFLVSA